MTAPSSREALARLVWAEIAGSDQRQVLATEPITEKENANAA